MDIKVIATDMDGTFLNQENDYDRERFSKIFTKLQERDIKFVPISGNQYYQIRSFFPHLEQELTIVSENGAYIVEQGKVIKSHRLPLDLVRAVLDYLLKHNLEMELSLCGEKATYILDKVEPEVKDFFAIYSHRLEMIESFHQLPDDHFLKFSFNTPLEMTQKIIDDLHQVMGNQIEAVTSGHGNIDIIARGINKGSAMSYLLKHWGYSPEQLLAFGDGNNDLQMLELAKYGYAMANGSKEIKEITNFRAPDNNKSGVLQVIEEYLEKIEKDN
ncbi:Cof-type HAD-IIB family hydrolase [Streptococcus massiliensis]|uniref:HAD superfamily hydrolase n=1 Tax=Streptococcus massiliensis TaxID=313439 RepID=A0A380L0I5_9STRE|nr:Cof-type HAD-IIB family hydrolase [Streptococcus massiliensis]SUN77539.1 HAD superfamily hydrolase [Streptococcus massiliensis]